MPVVLPAEVHREWHDNAQIDPARTAALIELRRIGRLRSFSIGARK
jgi:hypothetical protein